MKEAALPGWNQSPLRQPYFRQACDDIGTSLSAFQGPVRMTQFYSDGGPKTKPQLGVCPPVCPWQVM